MVALLEEKYKPIEHSFLHLLNSVIEGKLKVTLTKRERSDTGKLGRANAKPGGLLEYLYPRDF